MTFAVAVIFSLSCALIGCGAKKDADVPPSQNPALKKADR
jgi:hypothetical protein